MSALPPKTPPGPPSTRTWATVTRWTLVFLGITALVLAARRLPLESAVQRMDRLLDPLGGWGFLIYSGVYAVATVLFLPGSVLTAAAGVFFGPVWGTVSVSIGSTLGATLAFLIARHGARDLVARKLRQHPRFAAIDAAIDRSGWRVVAMLRLSPAIPFNLQNYLYGLTSIRLGPTLLTSWLCMLPATFLYVYLGYLSREGLEAAAGVDPPGTIRWIVLGLGLVMSIAVAVHIARLARKELHQQIDRPRSPRS